MRPLSLPEKERSYPSSTSLPWQGSLFTHVIHSFHLACLSLPVFIYTVPFRILCHFFLPPNNLSSSTAHKFRISYQVSNTFLNQINCFSITTMSDNNKQAPSTLQSYVDSATGAVQSAIGSLTGSTGDQAKGDAKQDAAKVEHDASKASIKVPGASISTDGGVSKDDPERTQGSWNQTVGSAKEAVGGLIGNEVSNVTFLTRISLPMY